MIYSFNLTNDYNEQKQFYLTADNLNQLYRRILSTYGMTKDRVELIAEYEETADYKYKLIKSYSDEDEVDNDIKKKAKELFSNSKRMSEPRKSEYIKKHKMTEISISTEKDLYSLIHKYKMIKVKWDLGEKRGQHSYYALVR